MVSRRSPADGQLPLSLSGGEAERPPLPARVSLPLAAEGHAPFDDDAYFFEPWWPGAHATLKREGGRLVLDTEHLADPLLAFPELNELAARIRADGVIIEGTLLALDADGRPDTRLLRRRLSGAADDESAEGAFVATDMPYLEGETISRLPFVERRRRLAAALEDSDHGVLGPGIVGEGRMLGRAVAALGLAAISARRLDARWKGGPAGDAWLRLPVVEPRAGERTPFLVLLERLPLGG
jgi:bifunctional non-homologous end joining protein LigD